MSFRLHDAQLDSILGELGFNSEADEHWPLWLHAVYALHFFGAAEHGRFLFIDHVLFLKHHVDCQAAFEFIWSADSNEATILLLALEDMMISSLR